MKLLISYKRWRYTSLIVLMFFSIFGAGFSVNRPIDLKDKVLDAVRNKFAENNNLTIKVTGNGDVNISGSVHSLYDKLDVFDIITRVRGVKKIEDNLYVKTPNRPADEIRDRIINNLEQTSAIKDPGRIKVHVDNGIVFLSGTVSFYREKELAETIASWQKGVKGIVDKIKVLPLKKAISDKNLEMIIKAMVKDEFPDYKDIKISINRGIATITGNVDYYYAKKAIEDEIYKVIGIKKVDDELKISG